MLAHPGMIGRALPREIERHFETEALRFLPEHVEIGHGAEPGLDRRVAAFNRTDRPWAPGIIRARGQAVVASFSEAAADRMNRRQIDDVEAEVGDVGQPRARVAEGSAPAAI